MNSITQEIYDGIVNGQSPVVGQKVQEALDSGMSPVVILNEGMIAAMAEVGKRFECGEYFVPEMLIAARAMQTGLALLKPHLQQSDLQSKGKVVIGTVKGDLHDIGKNLVGMMLEGAGFEIVDLGTDVSPEKFVTAAREHHGALVAMSALLTTTMPNMKTTIEALNAAGLRGQVKVLVGGAPVTENYARQISADGYAPDASRAVALAKSLV
ncbi:MAG TPA: corrinoid protein [Anaerolineales bacterium]|nr:corrinoid protein [Anaerolineales bacterium]